MSRCWSKKKIAPESSTEQNLISCLEVRSAGDPDEEDVVFTDLSPASLAEQLHAMGTPVGADAIRDWLEEADIRHRQIRKDLAGGEHPHRDAQFNRIAQWIAKYESDGNPWFSIDTKAKEHLGTLYRKGRVRSTKAFQAFDHDFPSWAEGVVIPHGIYDPVLNLGHINIGLSHDTSQFACDSFKWFWNRIGKQRYPDTTSILLTCDGGGSNSANKYIFKYDLERLSQSIGLEIRVAHYPPYCSKYNWIERRFFSHVARACSGMLFDTIETVVRLMRRASTSNGLKTTVNVIRRSFETGRNATKEMKENLGIIYDKQLPKWNYRAVPQINQ
ncbi:MAG: ISAzo13 family transposase [Gammaproteobacteria bacterium]|jgi:hypothetical protein|nr:ISAzo13 family transposase [Gammaproteobacteria bacterium]